MRNIHLTGLRFDSPELLGIFTELGLNVSTLTDERAIRRFLFGQNMEPTTPTRQKVRREMQIHAEIDSSGTLDGIFTGVQQEISRQVRDAGIAPEDVIEVTWVDNDSDHGDAFLVSYRALETDSEFEERQRLSDVFNALLEKQSEIFQRISMIGEIQAVSANHINRVNALIKHGYRVYYANGQWVVDDPQDADGFRLAGLDCNGIVNEAFEHLLADAV